jgi:hypothetical protein
LALSRCAVAKYRQYTRLRDAAGAAGGGAPPAKKGTTRGSAHAGSSEGSPRSVGALAGLSDGVSWGSGSEPSEAALFEAPAAAAAAARTRMAGAMGQPQQQAPVVPARARAQPKRRLNTAAEGAPARKRATPAR